MLLVVSGCGRVITKPTPTPFTPEPTATPTRPRVTPTPTWTPTSTPIPATPLPTATPTPEPTPIIHTLQPGDTLIGLARKYGVTVQSIQEANGITDPRGLLVGQRIIIPTDPEARLDQGQPTPPPTPPPIHIRPLTFHRGVDGLWALGEVRLEGETPLEGVVVQVDLLDDGAAVIASAQAPLLQTLVMPGEEAGFVVRFIPPPPDFDRYQSRVVRAQPAHVAFYHRELEAHDVLVQSAGEHVYTISGQVTNVGSEPAYQVAVIVTLLDEEGGVVGLRKVETVPRDIQPGEEALFAAELVPIHLPVADYRVRAEGHRQVMPHE